MTAAAAYFPFTHNHSRGKPSHQIPRLSGNDEKPLRAYPLSSGSGPRLALAQASQLPSSTRGVMECSASASTPASAATATTTGEQAKPTALEQLDKEQASGFWGQRFGSRVRAGVRRGVWGERPGNPEWARDGVGASELGGGRWKRTPTG